MNSHPMKFMPNWYRMFKSRDTDEKKLAFIKTILELMFEGKKPECADKDPSEFTSGVEYAVYDAYWTALPLVESNLREISVGAYGSKGGAPKGNRNAARKGDENKNNLGVVSKNNLGVDFENNPMVDSKNNPPLSMNMNMNMKENNECEYIAREVVLKKNDSPEGEVVFESGDGTAPALDLVLKVCRNSPVTNKIPEEFAREWYDTQVNGGWKDVKGTDIRRTWRQKLSWAWRDECKRNRENERKSAEEERSRSEAEARSAYWARQRLINECDD